MPPHKNLVSSPFVSSVTKIRIASERALPLSSQGDAAGDGGVDQGDEALAIGREAAG